MLTIDHNACRYQPQGSDPRNYTLITEVLVPVYTWHLMMMMMMMMMIKMVAIIIIIMIIIIVMMIDHYYDRDDDNDNDGGDDGDVDVNDTFCFGSSDTLLCSLLIAIKI